MFVGFHKAKTDKVKKKTLLKSGHALIPYNTISLPQNIKDTRSKQHHRFPGFHIPFEEVARPVKNVINRPAAKAKDSSLQSIFACSSIFNHICRH